VTGKRKGRGGIVLVFEEGRERKKYATKDRIHRAHDAQGRKEANENMKKARKRNRTGQGGPCLRREGSRDIRA